MEKNEASLGDTAAVKIIKEAVVIECKDLNEVTTTCEICVAFQSQLGG